MILINRTSWDVGDFVQMLKELPDGCPSRLLIDNAITPSTDACAYIIIRRNMSVSFSFPSPSKLACLIGPLQFLALTDDAGRLAMPRSLVAVAVGLIADSRALTKSGPFSSWINLDGMVGCLAPETYHDDGVWRVGPDVALSAHMHERLGELQGDKLPKITVKISQIRKSGAR